jgi:predicted ATPase/class 3 adenylate cyclase/DNA-binding NarL/FixJ family response regulator
VIISGVSELPAGTVTFLLTDVERSTERWERDPETMAAAMARHDEVLVGAIAAHGGTRPIEQGEGDSMVAAFALATDAVAAALDAQRELRRVDLGVRMAVHTGEARVRDDRYAGPAIIRAARLRDLARGGQVVVSQAARELVVDVLPAGASLEPQGEHEFKGLGRPEPVYLLRHPDLPDVAGLAARAAARPAHRVPLSLTPLIGRARELEGIADALSRSRLVTVSGPGGAGKTRLATEVARRQLGRRADGVWLVDLTAIDRDPADEVARTVDVGAGRVEPVEALRRHLADRDVLLVLDNCEHVIEGCAELAADLLTSCGGVRMLTTSREPLGVAGETVWRLDPLAPDDAQRLFVERARQRLPGFMPANQEDAAIARVCERLDRLPLAIELAAGRIGVMAPEEILEGIESQLDSLAAAGRPSPAHHRSVRAAVEWSYRLLDTTEQEAFRSLAVFVGGFDANAARAVAPGLSLDLLARLVDKSLVATARSARGRTRYRLLETVLDYARELLVESGELDAARERHLRHFAALSPATEPGLPSPGMYAFEHDLADDYENVRAALERSVTTDACAAMRLFAGTRDLFFLFGQVDGRRLAELVLDHCDVRDRNRIDTQLTAGYLALQTGDMAGAIRRFDEARTLGAELDAPAHEGWALFFRAGAEVLTGETASARVYLQASLDLFRRCGDRVGEARAMAITGLALATDGDHGAGRELVEQALAIDVEEGYVWGQGHANLFLGLIVADATTPDSPRAVAHLRAAVECLRPYRHANHLPLALIGLAAAMTRRDPERALRVTAAAFAMREHAGGRFPPLYQARADAVRAATTAALGADADRIWAEGLRLSGDDAIALACGRKTPRARSHEGLSPREEEVIRLVASGLTNKEVASQLHLSVRTVESHVRNSLTKLGLANRTQLATWARARLG